MRSFFSPLLTLGDDFESGVPAITRPTARPSPASGGRPVPVRPTIGSTPVASAPTNTTTGGATATVTGTRHLAATGPAYDVPSTSAGTTGGLVQQPVTATVNTGTSAPPAGPSGGSGGDTSGGSSDVQLLADLVGSMFGSAGTSDNTAPLATVPVDATDVTAPASSNKGMLIVIILLAAGLGFYFWKKHKRASAGGDSGE